MEFKPILQAALAAKKEVGSRGIADKKNAAIRLAAQAMITRLGDIIAANRADLRFAPYDEKDSRWGRLQLTPESILSQAKAMEEVANLPDLVGQPMEQAKVRKGFSLARTRVPLGLVGGTAESRPLVAMDIASLAVKAGNTCLYRPGSDCLATSAVLAKCFSQGLQEAGFTLPGIVQVLPDPKRTMIGEMLASTEIDLFIARGGRSLIKRVMDEARCQVLAHLDGNCHVYLHSSALAEAALEVAVHSKVNRPGVCNAAEKLLVDRSVAATLLPAIAAKMVSKEVELRACPESGKILSEAKLPWIPATEQDWGEEYLALRIAIKVVDGLDEAIDHINRYGSHHTDSIVATDEEAIARFQWEVDSASVLANTTTRAGDGNVYGLGCEVGISTGKLHARGPAGIEALTTYKWFLQASEAYCLR